MKEEILKLNFKPQKSPHARQGSYETPLTYHDEIKNNNTVLENNN